MRLFTRGSTLGCRSEPQRPSPGAPHSAAEYRIERRIASASAPVPPTRPPRGAPGRGLGRAAPCGWGLSSPADRAWRPEAVPCNSVGRSRLGCAVALVLQTMTAMSDRTTRSERAAPAEGPWQRIAGHAAAAARRRVALAELRARVSCCRDELRSGKRRLADLPLEASRSPSSSVGTGGAVHQHLEELVSLQQAELLDATSELQALARSVLSPAVESLAPWHHDPRGLTSRRAPLAQAGLGVGRGEPAEALGEEASAVSALLHHLDMAWARP